MHEVSTVSIYADTELRDGLKNLKTQIYKAECNMYDTAKAIIVRLGRFILDNERSDNE